MRKVYLFFSFLFLIQFTFSQERITEFIYEDEGINAFTRTLTELNGTLIFNAYSTEYGDEMWIYSNQDGLKLLKDIFIGESPSFPDYQSTGFVKYRNEIYFVANDGVHGYELWKTNGIETNLVYDVVEGVESSLPKNLTVHDEYLYFVVEKKEHYHLCRFDGSNLEIIKDFGENEYGVAYTAGSLTASSNNLYFTINGSDLWISNGTEEGTKKIKDLFGLYYLTSIREKLYFTGEEDFQGEKELWVSDGTENGTKMVKNIDGDNSSWPFGLINFNGELFFTAKTNEFGRELWKSDGTEEGTNLLIDINTGSESAFTSYDFCVNRNQLLFCANNGDNGNELWKTDGTRLGTVMIKDISSGNPSSTPKYMTKIQEHIYFQANESVHGTELWKTDGTESGTVLASDILSGTPSSSPNNIGLAGNDVFFIAESNSFGRQVWKIPHKTIGTFIESNNAQSISIYPNPCDDYIFINSKLIDDNVSIYSSNGQLVLTEKLMNGEIDISSLGSGLYFLKLNIKGKVLTKKIVKK